ncbi:MarR family winged helix-turn-helix transcriptional regulator [Streptomyces virginiae]|uniref:MarR family winged helix-turn-helix transcriptional regulator n=1 Tax=Streptomyces TaxID=1883 RepID=UPI0006ADEDED|nr:MULTISPECIES: MarR family transcriptional regulator [unclassified Streptomyces]KOU10924.1 MarR family transcriptional regulator [Streptomyces sp. WM6349]KOV41402.1 MarR family transcriptional regulator [Streptomyces sp. H036]MCI4079045.1 MarR family transcriptional regulator [Streptomyces sp. MMS21 TC-5]QNE29675.1 MarR family transcriptional regulator [Streptomyces sp. INR7]
MSHRSIGSPRPAVSAVAEMSELIELLEVVWERGRDTASAAPVSSAQARVLFLVEANDQLNLRELGRLLEAAPPSVTRLCDRLQAVGFLERHPGADDRREVLLRLTPAGRTYLERLRDRRQEVLAEAMAAMPEASRAALATGLADFCAAVSKPLRLPSPNSFTTRTA